MPKHAPNVPKGTPSDRSDERIGLTEAFSPVGDAQAPVDGSDERIGLTEAFSPVGDGAHAGGFSYRSTLMPSRLLSRLTLLRSCSATIP